MYCIYHSRGLLKCEPASPSLNLQAASLILGYRAMPHSLSILDSVLVHFILLLRDQYRDLAKYDPNT